VKQQPTHERGEWGSDERKIRSRTTIKLNEKLPITSTWHMT